MRYASDIAYEMLPHQDQFHFSRKAKDALIGGYGSGKTYSLIMKGLDLAGENLGLPGGCLCPDLKMFRRDVLPALAEVCFEYGIEWKYFKQDGVIWFPQTQTPIYIFHSEDDGESIRGPNLAFMLINEVTLCTKLAYEAAVGRVRHEKAILPQIAMSGTPEGFNWFYHDVVLKAGEDTEIIYAKTLDNPHLHPMYISTLRSTYDERTLSQYMDGQFVNFAGMQAAWAFNRNRHVRDLGMPDTTDREIIVSLDFNMNPMAAACHILGGAEDPFKFYTFKQYKLMGSDTDDFAQKLAEDFPNKDLVVIFPDPAGNTGSTKSKGHSDFDILRNHGFRNIRYKSKISVKDCLNSMNRIFSRDEAVIHPSCKDVIADMEMCVLKDSGQEIIKNDSMRTHWLDGYKNMCDYLYPIVKPTVKVEVTSYA